MAGNWWDADKIEGPASAGNWWDADAVVKDDAPSAATVGPDAKDDGFFSMERAKGVLSSLANAVPFVGADDGKPNPFAEYVKGAAERARGNLPVLEDGTLKPAEPKKFKSVLETQAWPDTVPSDDELRRLSRRDYAKAQEDEARRIRTGGHEMRATKPAPVLSAAEAGAKRFAEDNPVTASIKSSAAQSLAGLANAPSAAAQAGNEMVRNAMIGFGADVPASRVPNMPLVDDLMKMSGAYTSELQRRAPGEAWDRGEFGQWLLTQLGGNSMNTIQSLGALMVPGMQGALLTSMGATAAGTSYATGDSGIASIGKGVVEAASEKLPLEAAGFATKKVSSLIEKIPAASRNAILQDAGRRLVAAGGAVTFNSLVGAIEESAAQIGGNAIDIAIDGKTKSLFDEVDRAAIVGAAANTSMAAPAIIEAARRPTTDAGRLAGELADALNGGQFAQAGIDQTVSDMLRTVGTSDNIAPTSTSMAAAAGERARLEQMRAPRPTVADIGKAASVDEAIATAEQSVAPDVPPSVQPAQAAQVPAGTGRAVQLDEADLLKRAMAGIDMPQEAAQPALAQAAPVVEQQAAPEAATPAEQDQPVRTWFGRRGDGYATPEDAQRGLSERQRLQKDLQWRIEQTPEGRYRLAGYAAPVGAAQALQTPSPKAEPAMPKPLPAARSASQGQDIILQNRDRNTPASIDQMQSIAANPDYLRAGPSRTMDQGAPVAFGAMPPSAVQGRVETVADGRGQRIQTQYAVVEAADLLASNQADGTPVPEYAAGESGRLRVVAGNGRTAGLQAAYLRGTAAQYREELQQDAQSLGIDPQAVAAMREPVLIRVMDEADVTPDIADRSNIQAGSEMSAVERANNDARRIHVSDMEFHDNGTPTEASLLRFIQSMPVSERGGLVDDKGPTQQAIDRVMAVAFKQAYGGDELVRLFAQATDPESRVVIGALARIAGRMAQLDGAGAFDIRGAVADAAGMAITAKRRGKKLADIVLQGDLDLSPEAVVVARFMADNIRSGQRIADGLLAWVDLALDQVRIVEQNARSTGMFGEEPTLSRQQLFERLGKNGNTATAIEEPAAQRGGAVAAGEGAERREAEPAGDGRGAEDGAGGRGAETEESGQQVERAPSVGQDLLGDKPNTSQQQAADERARRASQDQQRRNAAPAPEEFALGMEDARTGREVDPNQQELLGGVEQAAPADDFTADIAQAERDLADLQTQHQAARGKKREELTGRIDRLQKEVELLRQVDKAVDDEGRQRFTVSIPLLGDVPYRASKPVDADSGEVVSSRVITTKTKLTKAQAQSLGLPADKGQVFAWRVSVVRGDGGVYSAIEVMAQDHGRSPDGEVLAHFKPVDTPEAVERVAPAVMKAAAADLQAAQDADADTLPGFSRKPSAPWRMEAGDEVVIADINRAIAPSGAQVTAVASFDELPQLVKEKAKAHGVGPKEMRGITLGGGRVFVVHGNHSSLADVQATIVHEVYGHVGLRALFGPDIYRRLNKLYLSLGDSKVRALAEKYGVDAAYFDMANQLKASPAVVRRAGGATELRNGWLAEELLAHIAERETGTLRQQARELVGAIRAWLREHGFMQLSDLGMTDIAHILKQGRLALETQSNFDGVDAQPAFAKNGAGERNLVVLHNLSPDNLLHADSAGGLPVPSLGIAKVDSPFSGYGNITLIGPSGMIDPEAGVPVYDRDAYTSRFPTMNYKRPKRAKADALYERLQALRGLGDDGGQFQSMLWDTLVNSNSVNPSRVSELFDRYTAPRMLYAQEVLGKTIKTPMRDVRLRTELVRHKPLRDFLQRHGRTLRYLDDTTQEQYDAAARQLDKVVAEALASSAIGGKDEKVSAMLRDVERENLLGDDGAVSARGLERLLRSAEDFGKKEPDSAKLAEAVNRVVKRDDAGYVAWVNQQLAGLFDEPTITLRGKEVAPTLDNLVAAMTMGATAGAEKTMTASAGKTAAQLGKRFKSVAEIQAARDQVVSEAQENEAKKTNDATLDQYRSSALAFFTEKDWRGNVDTWAGMDAAMEVLADAGKSGSTDAAIRQALAKRGFKSVDQAVVNLAREAIDALRNSPTNYFEAKPQRAVGLGEFRGAVLPRGTDPKVLAVLDGHGIQVLAYGKGDGAREKAIATLTKRLDKAGKDVLFSRSASTKAAYEARIDALFAGGKPTLDGVRVLDRSDMLALLGMGDGPVNLAEGKVTAGQDNHPHMTAAMWKKIPQWLDNPALVFDSDTTPGRLVFIAPELVNGAPVRIIVEPNAAGSINAHLLVNAYDAERNPFQRWEREGSLRYFDQQKAPSISGTFQPRLTGLPGNKRRGKILTQKHLAGYRRANDPQRSSEPQPSTTGATVATITDAIRQAYGNVLPQLQANGLVTLVQSQDEAIEAAAKARADKTGESLETVRERLMASVRNSIAVWHGSPHRWIEKTGFKLNKIGSGEGEGAQLLFAKISESDPGFTESVRDKLFADVQGLSGRRQREAFLGALDNVINGSPTLDMRVGLSQSSNSKAAPTENIDQSVVRDFERLSDIVASQAFVEQGYGGLDIKTRALVVDAMFKVVNDLKIAKSVVELIPVDVMNILGWSQASAYALFDDVSVLKNALAVDLNPSVATMNAASALIDGVALLSAEKLSGIGSFNRAFFPKHWGSAAKALQGEHRSPLAVATAVLSQIQSKPTMGEGASGVVLSSESMLTPDAAQIEPKFSKNGAIQGFFDPQTGQSFLIADGLTEAAAPGVLAHEVGIHMAADTSSDKGKAAFDKITARAGQLLKLGRGNPFFDRVNQRMLDAQETSNEEAAAYIAEEYERDRVNAPASVKRWVTDFMAAVRGWLFGKGVLVKASDLGAADIAAIARANVRKAARGTIDPRADTTAWSPDRVELRFSRSGNTATQGSTYTLPEERFGGLRRKMQDYFIRALEVQNAVAQQGGAVDEQTDFYRAEERSSGRRAALVQDFGNNVVNPLMERAAELGVDLQELALYAYAKHAQERNEYIATINDRLPDGGSGMTTADADAILDKVRQEGREQDFEELHQGLMDITASTRALQLSEGLITQDEFDAMQAQYQNYIPLRGFEQVDEDGKTTGRSPGKGFNIRGQENLRALGRSSRAGELIENAIHDYIRTVDRGERNQVGKVFLNFVLKNPDASLWEVDAERTRAAMDRQTGKVKGVTSIDKGEDTIAVKVAGREVYVRIHDPLLLRAMRKSHTDDRGDNERLVVRALGLYTSLLRNTLTRYNPEFALTNALRDYGFGMAAMVDELGEKGAAKFTAHYAGAVAAAHRNERNTTDPQSREWDKYFTEFRLAGGMTAGFYVKNTEEIGKDIRTIMLKAGAEPKNKTEALLASSPARAIAAAGRVLGYAGSVSENAARVAAYRTAREMGKSPSEAASIAKNLTANFDRKGELGQVINAAYVFYNAAVQGSHRLLKMASNPKVAGYMAGFGSAGLALALANADWGGDDPDDGMAYWDKIPAYEKERNLIIMLPPSWRFEDAQRVGTDGHYVKIPLQYGLNLPVAYGYAIADVIRNHRDKSRGMSPVKAGVTMASYLAGAFNPFGGSVDLSNGSSMAQAALPSLGDAVVQFATGTNGFGRDVAPFKSPFDTKPDSENYNLRQADSVSLKIAQLLNRATGGSAAEAGGIDISAGTVENLIRNVSGGTGAFLYDVGNLAWKSVDRATGGDPDIFVREMPLARRMYGELGGDVDQGIFYDSRKKTQEAAGIVKRSAELDMEPSEENQTLARMDKFANKATRDLAKLRREMIRVKQDDSLSNAEKTKELRELRAARDQITAGFNQAFTEVMREFFAEQKSTDKINQ